MQEFAQRMLQGWFCISVRLFVNKHNFRVTVTNDDTGASEVLYEGDDFGQASEAYLHTNVRHLETVESLAEVA